MTGCIIDGLMFSLLERTFLVCAAVGDGHNSLLKKPALQRRMWTFVIPLELPFQDKHA
jgi:hypothetical protein